MTPNDAVPESCAEHRPRQVEVLRGEGIPLVCGDPMALETKRQKKHTHTAQRQRQHQHQHQHEENKSNTSVNKQYCRDTPTIPINTINTQMSG